MKQEGTFNVAREWRTDFFEVGTVRREIVISQARGCENGRQSGDRLRIVGKSCADEEKSAGKKNAE